MRHFRALGRDASVAEIQQKIKLHSLWLERCGVGGGSSARFGEAQEKRPLTEEAEAGAEAEAEADAEAATGAATRAGAGAGFDAGGGGAAAHVREAVRRAVGGEGCASNLPATSPCLATPRYPCDIPLLVPGDEGDARELMALALREARGGR